MGKQWDRAVASLRPEEDDAPIVEHAPGLTLREVVTRFWPRLRPLRRWLVLAVVLLAAAPAIEVAEILLFQRLVDDVLVPAEWRPLVWLAVIYLSLNLLSAVISGFDDYLATWISQKFLLDLRVDVFRHVLSLPLHVHERRRLGDVMSRLTSDVAAVETFMIGHMAGGIDAVVRIVFFVGALFYLDWALALASLVVVPLFWWVSRSFAEFVRRLSRERRRRSGSLSAVTEENLSNGPLVQSYNREADAVERYHRQNQAIFSAELAGSRVRGVFLPLVDLTELAGTLTVVAMGVWALDSGRLTLGGLLAFLTLLAQCYRPIRDLADLLPSLYSATAGIERLVELLDEEPPRDRPGATPLVAPRGVVRLDHVSARYPGARRARARRRQPRPPPRRGRRRRRRQRRRQVDPGPGADPPPRPRGRVGHPRRRPRRRHHASARCATPSPWCCRRRCCWTRRSPRTSPSRGPAPPVTRYVVPRAPRTPTPSSARCPTATTPVSASAAGCSPAASGSGSRWPGRCCATARSSCSTSRRPVSTRTPPGGCSRRCATRPATVPSSS